MIARWCVSTLIFTLTLFGVVNQQQITLPNQEIVLQFTDVSLTPEDSQYAISVLKTQLEGLGAENIQVSIQDNGSVKIAYFSDSDTASIKKILSGNNTVSLGFASNQQNNFPKAPLSTKVSYNLDVYEIQKNQDYGRNLEGTVVLQIETKINRFLDPKINLNFSGFQISNDTLVVGLTYKVFRTIEISSKNTLLNIPEGRAGPKCT